MNVLIVTNQLSVGGAEHFVVRLANELHARGHTPVVASSGGSLVRLLAPGIRHAYVPGREKRPLQFAALVQRLGALMRAAEIDIVHANSPTTALAARFARAGRRIPIVASAHGSWEKGDKPAVARLFSAGADRVVGVSEALTNDLVRHGLSRRKAITIHNGIPLAARGPDRRRELRASLRIPTDAPVILTAARLSVQKGLEYLISAMPAILERHPDARLLLAGDGDRRDALEASSERAGLFRSVRFLGSRDDVPDLLGAADVFCLPSLVEGLPLALVEAMAAGLPAVASEVGGVPEVVVDGVTGWLVPPRNPGALALRLGELLGAPDLGRAMGEAGRERALELFTLDRMVSRFEALYDAELAAVRKTSAAA